VYIHIEQVDGRVRTLATSTSISEVYVGGDFGVGIYQDNLAIRPLVAASSTTGASRLTGPVLSLAIAESCIYIAGALRFSGVGSTNTKRARLVRYCPSTMLGTNSSMETLSIDDDVEADWKQGIVLQSLNEESLSFDLRAEQELCWDAF